MPLVPIPNLSKLMGGFDSYCFICGAQAQVASTIVHAFKISAKKGSIPPVGSEKVQRFLLDKQDRAFLQDLVSIGPYDADDEPIIDDQEIYRGALDADENEAARLAAIEPETIRMIEGLVPGGSHDLGSIERPSGESFNVNAAVYPFGHALCFKLLAAFAPRLMQPVGKFWATVRAANGTHYTRLIDGVDYGDVTGSQEQFVWPFHMYGGWNYEDQEDASGSDGTGDDGVGSDNRNDGSDNGNEVRDVDVSAQEDNADNADNASNDDDDNEEGDADADGAEGDDDNDGDDDAEGSNDDGDNEDDDGNNDDGGIDENDNEDDDSVDPGSPQSWEDENLPKAIKAALNKEPLDPVDLHAYWINKGCMYVWVRPDKFPVREAFQEPLNLISCEERTKQAANHLADLPIDVLLIIAQALSLRDVLSLFGLCTSLRAKLISCADTLARQHLTWAVPSAVGEQERWDSLLQETNESSHHFPWLSYARQCYLSPSMRNRQRIWGICKQLEGLAVCHGVI